MDIIGGMLRKTRLSQVSFATLLKGNTYTTAVRQGLSP